MTVQLELGEALKSAGTAQALANNERYSLRFFLEARWILGLHGQVTAEQVVSLIGMPEGSPNAVGAAMRAFAHANKLVVAGYKKTSRPSRHSGLIAIWRKA